jgi:hypothetical protein
MTVTVHLGAVLLLMLGAGLSAGVTAQDASQPSVLSQPDRDALSEALDAAKQLWHSLGTLRERLLGQAERALDQADRAATLAERQQQEALYRHISERLIELDQTRTELDAQLERLRQSLDTSSLSE